MSTNALGYCEDVFNPKEPGRLCRGRERWIESPIEQPHVIHRFVISGAAFSDESANDARRGLSFSGLSIGDVISALFSRRKLHAWAEEALPARVPDAASAVEYFTTGRPGGPLQTWGARWTMPVIGAAAAEAAIEAGADVLVVPRRGALDPEPIAPALTEADLELPPLADAIERPMPQLGEGLRQRLYLLTGFRCGIQPTRRFQPGALPELLEHVEAIILVHQDKHAPCLGVYSREPMDLSKTLTAACRKKSVLAVPFAIPPMLARWDRALWELRQEWDADQYGEFPVPPAPEGVHSWGRRYGRRRNSVEE